MKARVLILFGLAAAGVALLLLLSRGWHIQQQATPQPEVVTNVTTVAAAPSKPSPPPRHHVIHRSDMTPEQEAKLAKVFAEKLEPAFKKWSAAYKGRIPFNPEDFTLDKFHSSPADQFNTFMLGDTTVVIVNPKEGPAKFFYMMTRGGSDSLNSTPHLGAAPDLTTPITREEVVRMVKADTGVEFKPSEVYIKPTGAASSLMGGAFVNVTSQGDDPNNYCDYKVSMVFGPDGKLVNYQRSGGF